MKTINVLIIDDSALTRAVLTKIIESAPGIKVIGTAPDPIIAKKKIALNKPHVITLDIEMPRMNGLTFLEKLMKQNPIATIVISGNSPKSSLNAIKALELGAVDIIEKPDISTPEKLSEVSETIIQSIKTAYTAQPSVLANRAYAQTTLSPSMHNKRPAPINEAPAPANKIVLIGASTGGPDLIRYIFSNVTNDDTGYVIAQHMPSMFTKSFAERLNDFSKLFVSEASDGQIIEKGKILLVPGDHHGEVKRSKNGYMISLNQNDKVNRHRPSIDVLFNSGTIVPKSSLKAILLTGMGQDGALGLKKIYDYGATTIAQEASSCVVYGMPKRAIELGAAKDVLAPDKIIEILNNNKLL